MSKRLLQESLDEINVKRTKQDEAAIENHVAEASTSHERFQAKDSRENANDSPVAPDLQLECLFTDEDDSDSTVENVRVKDCREKVNDSPVDPDLQLECLFTDEDDGDSSVKDVGVEPPGINEQQLNDNLDDTDSDVDSEYRDVDDDILEDIDTDDDILLDIDTNDMIDTDDANEEGDINDLINDMIDTDDANEEGDINDLINDMIDTDDANEGDTDDMIQDPGDVTPERRTHFETEDED